MSSNYQLTGRVIHVGETEEIGAKKFKKRAIVIETDGDSKWPQQVPVEFVGDNVGKLDGYMRDVEVEIDFDIRGREWKGKYYVNLQGWKIRKVGVRVEERRPAKEQAPHGYVDFSKDDGDDEIPF